MPIFLPRIESERSVSGIASAISGSLTITSEKPLSLRTLSDLPIEIRTVAEVRPAVSSISRACAPVEANGVTSCAAATIASKAAQLAALAAMRRDRAASVPGRRASLF